MTETHPRRTIWYYLIPITILAVGAGLAYALIAMKTETPRRNPQARTKMVSISVVEPATLNADIEAYGRVASAQPVRLISEVSGELQSGGILFKNGASFRRGDLLIKVDDRQARFALDKAKADLLTALAQALPEIKIDTPDAYPAWETFFSECRFDRSLPELPKATNTRVRMFLARFNVYKNYFTARDLEIQLEKHYFYAPFDGAVVAANLQNGSIARAGSEIGEIISLERAEVEIPLAGDEIAWLNTSEPVRLHSNEINAEWQGSITRISSALDARTQTVPVFVTIDGDPDPRLIDGLFLDAYLGGTPIDNAVRVPRRALYQDRYVYVIENGALQQREVSIARNLPEDVLVNSGLSVGDTLVVEMLQGVAPGMKAVPRPEITEG